MGVNFQAPSFLEGKKIAHQEVALPCWNGFCQLTSEGCGIQPLLKPLFPYEGWFGKSCHVSTTACLKARASFVWECFRLPSVVAMGGKEQSYWTLHYKYLSLSSVQLNYLTILWWSKQYGLFPSAKHLYWGDLRCNGFLNNSPTSQFLHLLLTNQNAMWPNWPIFDQFLPNFSPILHQLFTNFSPVIWFSDQLSTNCSPTWPTSPLHQLFPTSTSSTSPTFHQIHQLFTNSSPTFHQFFTNFTNVTSISPTFHQLDELLTNLTNLTY